ncbi:LEA type 2 family protein [Variovorax sp. J22R133]|uniref:LEA type 2 family protein n=1 Tax=Variovorax brevis TaxID=3053503 RepID=UPI00257717F3|nr:LEA type 2 family protein [Variovorax sp. J22R133]MDM0114784.1 LEA type 2 family protein [Variovorax sp. J22R133]
MAVAGCASWPGSEPLRVTLAGVEPLSGEGMEMRLRLKLRVQNPNTGAIDYQGVSVTLNLRGSTLASGVSPEAGSVPGFGEQLIEIPVTVSAVAALRQIFGMASGSNRALDYVLRGRLGGGLGGHAFEASGKIDWPAGASPWRSDH